MDIGVRRGSRFARAAIQSASVQENRVVSRTIDAVDGRSSAPKPTGSALSGSNVPSAPTTSYL